MPIKQHCDLHLNLWNTNNNLGCVSFNDNYMLYPPGLLRIALETAMKCIHVKQNLVQFVLGESVFAWTNRGWPFL